MTDIKNDNDGGPEKLSPEALRALSGVGWRVPQTPEEVTQAEAWLKEHGPELPPALQNKSLDDLSQKLIQERRLEH